MAVAMCDQVKQEGDERAGEQGRDDFKTNALVNEL